MRLTRPDWNFEPARLSAFSGELSELLAESYISTTMAAIDSSAGLLSLDTLSESPASALVHRSVEVSEADVFGMFSHKRPLVCVGFDMAEVDSARGDAVAALLSYPMQAATEIDELLVTRPTELLLHMDPDGSESVNVFRVSRTPTPTTSPLTPLRISL